MTVTVLDVYGENNSTKPSKVFYPYSKISNEAGNFIPASTTAARRFPTACMTDQFQKNHTRSGCTNLVQLGEHVDSGVKVDASIGDTNTVLESSGAGSRNILATVIDV